MAVCWLVGREGNFDGNHHHKRHNQKMGEIVLHWCWCMPLEKNRPRSTFEPKAYWRLRPSLSQKNKYPDAYTIKDTVFFLRLFLFVNHWGLYIHFNVESYSSLATTDNNMVVLRMSENTGGVMVGHHIRHSLSLFFSLPLPPLSSLRPYIQKSVHAATLQRLLRSLAKVSYGH